MSNHDKQRQPFNPLRLPSRRLALWSLVALLIVGVVEGWRGWTFYKNVTSARVALLALRDDLELSSLRMEGEEVLRIERSLVNAAGDLSDARSFLAHDPLFAIGIHLPVIGDDIRAVKELTLAANAAAAAGLASTEVISDFNALEDDPDRTSIQEAIDFLQDQSSAMQRVRANLDDMNERSARVPSGIAGPLREAHDQLNDATKKLTALVEGYERAQAFLPSLLGYGEGRRYLMLFQNDTELFPSGGLISNYGLVEFDEGLLVRIEFEYFVNLYDRWQETSNGEYVEPPRPLKDYLLKDVSWALGEAGWYPDFPTTADLATTFVEKGGVTPTDGTIAIDLQFVEAILSLVGPVEVPDYGVTVTSESLSEITLEQTRDESPNPGAPQKAFLSSLAQEILVRIFALPQDQWIDMLRVLDRMARERHLQIHMDDENLQGLGTEYGLDGAIEEHHGDFLLIADSSVLSTKLNLILQTSIEYKLQLRTDGWAAAHVVYQVNNPFDQWEVGRDEKLVSALMINGIYGSYLRVYTKPGAQIRDVRLDGQPVGASQINEEVGKQVFGRFFRVMPGETRRAEFVYTTPGVVIIGETMRYSLYIQKQPGTREIPFRLQVQLPSDTELAGMYLDGEPAGEDLLLETDLTVDRIVDIEFRFAEDS